MSLGDENQWGHSYHLYYRDTCAPTCAERDLWAICRSQPFQVDPLVSYPLIFIYLRPYSSLIGCLDFGFELIFIFTFSALFEWGWDQQVVGCGGNRGVWWKPLPKNHRSRQYLSGKISRYECFKMVTIITRTMSNIAFVSKTSLLRPDKTFKGQEGGEEEGVWGGGGLWYTLHATDTDLFKVMSPSRHCRQHLWYFLE